MLNLNKIRSIVIFLSIMSVSSNIWSLDSSFINESLSSASENYDLTVEEISEISDAFKSGVLELYDEGKDNSKAITIGGGGIIVGGTLVNRLAATLVENSGIKYAKSTSALAATLIKYANQLGGLGSAAEHIDDSLVLIADKANITRKIAVKNGLKIGAHAVKDFASYYGYKFIQVAGKWVAVLGVPVTAVGGVLWTINSAADEKGLDEEVSLSALSNFKSLQDYIENTPQEQIAIDMKDDPALKKALDKIGFIYKLAKNLKEDSVSMVSGKESDIRGNNDDIQHYSTGAQVVIESVYEKTSAETIIQE